MRFKLLLSIPNPPTWESGVAYLEHSTWNDWYKYQTRYRLVVVDHAGHQHEIGTVKIGEVGLTPGASAEPGKRVPSLPPEFDALDTRYFSLGADDSYYEAINALPGDLRPGILEGLRDCAYDLTIFEAMQNEDVMGESLLRNVPTEKVRNRFHRLAHGNAELTEFKFEYELAGSSEGGPPPPRISFDVMPHSEPPTNVHVLIGRNGVGKTRCMQHMAAAILLRTSKDEDVGEFRPVGSDLNNWYFSGLVAVSFSAFDSFELPSPDRLTLRATLVSLPRQSPSQLEDTQPSMPDRQRAVTTSKLLAMEFGKSFGVCRHGPRRDRWRAAVSTLGNDPLFAEAQVEDLLSLPEPEWERSAMSLFSRLSSGHAIVLLTITRLVELVDERTFVLLDEPEGHLHPPLLSAFVRALSDLLVKRNGVALVATHSPVVLQEVPRSCVWTLRRSGKVSAVERPARETFGENVSILTGEIFGFEVTNTGFHQMLSELIKTTELNYEEVLIHFGGQLGAEARAIARSLIALRDSRTEGRS